MAHNPSPESAAWSGFRARGRRTLPDRRQIWKWAEDDVANAIEMADCLVLKTELRPWLRMSFFLGTHTPRLMLIAVGSEGQRSALSVLLDHLHSFLFLGWAHVT